MTIAETDRADNNSNLKTLYEAQELLLHDIIGKQHEVSTNLISCKDSLDALQDKIDQSQTPNAAGPASVDDQKVILNAIKSEIEQVKDGLADSNTNTRDSTTVEPGNYSNFASALTITSNLAALMISGTMIASARALATQAREMSTIARRFEVHCPPIEQSTDQQSISTTRPSKEPVEFANGSDRVIADAVDPEQFPLDSDPGSCKSDVHESSSPAVCHSQEERAEQSQEIQMKTCLTGNQELYSHDSQPRTKTVYF